MNWISTEVASILMTLVYAYGLCTGFMAAVICYEVCEWLSEKWEDRKEKEKHD